jgi:hypothetical protein
MKHGRGKAAQFLQPCLYLLGLQQEVPYWSAVQNLVTILSLFGGSLAACLFEAKQGVAFSVVRFFPS